ncbi:MAG: hypothetical protein HY327_03755 [Chloroflexi bacterium]|nr:hypothetical protein [Chloroflexota bacterium]
MTVLKTASRIEFESGGSMDATLTMPQAAVPLVKSSLELKHRALELNQRAYKQRLDHFEQAHQMTSDQFAARFSNGELGDASEWFEWEFALDALKQTEQQLELLDSVRL